MPADPPLLNQVNLVVRDMEASARFYRRLGISVEMTPDGRHAVAVTGNGMRLEFDSPDFVSEWDSGWRGATGGSAVLGFAVPSRDAVDEVFDNLVAAGHRGHQPPYDAFWGARYAIVDDPDGNGVGLMSPIDPAQTCWPPQPPPQGRG